MALLENAEPLVQANHLIIATSLQAKESGDAVLAEALYRSWKQGYYRQLGYRSIAEYLREIFAGTELDAAARLHARSVQRLIKEWRLAEEIPAFRAVFDEIPRSKRRLLAQVLTADNVEEWLQRAKTLTVRELETLIARQGEAGVVEVDKPVRWTVMLYPAQRALVDLALEVAGRELARDGGDPEGAVGVRLEMLAQEFIATYGGPAMAGEMQPQ